jgi:hypothetical protein
MATQQEDQPAEGHGAAAGSLNDPACKRGTKEFKAAKEENGRLLGLYRSFKEGHEETGVSGTTQQSNCHALDPRCKAKCFASRCKVRLSSV